MLNLDMPELPTTSLKERDEDIASPSRIAYMENALGIPFTYGNTVEPLNNGNEIFPAMLSAIRSSHDHIELLTYIYWSGDVAKEFADALSERSMAGVTVRVLLDSFGCSDIKREYLDEMAEAGVQIQWFRPVKKSLLKFDWRTHRKVLICDGRIAFTGGVGIAAEWEGDARNPDEWRETHFRVRGPAVKCLSGAFWDNWFEENEIPLKMMTANPNERPHGLPLQVVRSNSGYRVSDAHKVLHAMINLATERLDIVTPYFVPEPGLLKLMCEKARNGVSVRVLIPDAYTDKRFERLESARYFDDLTKAGAEVHLYQKTMIHTKLMLCDDELALFGSINFNRRSLLKDEEIGVVVGSPTFVREMRQTVERDLDDAIQLDRSKWSGPNTVEFLVQRLLTPFRDQL
ncbi:phospholipase D-like domain-containing protein [Cerasicoccus fimbriatus]|uniref:phospholipase D-like domain-containing protein n=1 Tax=Cerasicoccus fimbriatus TaxID=3014554 RepID=UPI0022B4EC93|nr:phospholipase D-like domain-containing protein [Cerasicoccus sp. TK19100]